MRGKVIIFALLLAGCSSGSSSPPPAPVHPVQVSMNASAWSLVYSIGSQITSAPGGGFQFAFPATSAVCPEPTETTTPTCPSVHYIETASPLLRSGQTITMTGFITASSDAVFNYGIDADNTAPGGHPPACRIWFEQAGDQALTQPYYRWWANDPADVVLKNGAFSISAKLTPTWTLENSDGSASVVSGWTSVEGEQANNSAAATAGFAQAMANVASIGFTCGGGSFYGHGDNMSQGTATMTINRFTVTP